MNVLIVDGDVLIMRELRVFKDRMYDGAEAVELIAGIECLNFLLEEVEKVEEISEDTKMFVEAALYEANMRAKLILTLEQEKNNEMHEKISRCVRILGRQLEEIQRKFSSPFLAEEVMEIVQKRIHARMDKNS